MTSKEFEEMALAFPNTEANPHFDRTAYKVVKRRNFATLHEASGTANIKLTPLDQSSFCAYDTEAAYPVPNKWGLQGWTTFDLTKAPQELIAGALEAAYQDVVAGKKK